jgi:hypothetical protein
MKITLTVILALVMVLTMVIGFSTTAAADQPTFASDKGAYVRLLGTPENGTVKFQYGWEKDTPASAAVGYWVGVYDVTNSHYEWSFDTGPFAAPVPELFLNAHPTPKLDPGVYKINFFVRASYSPDTNIVDMDGAFYFTVVK